MIFGTGNFEIEVNSIVLKIEEHTVGGSTLFRVEFPNGRFPIVITRALSEGKKVWVSVGMNRNKEAVEIGTKIVEFYRKTNS